MRYKINHMRMIAPESLVPTDTYSISDEAGEHKLAITNGEESSSLIVVFHEERLAQLVVQALNESATHTTPRPEPTEETRKVIGRRLATGQYEVPTEQGTFSLSVDKQGSISSWEVKLPSGKPLAKPFETKRQAMAAIAEAVAEPEAVSA